MVQLELRPVLLIAMGIPGQWKTSMHLYNNVFKYNKLKYRFSLFFLKKNSKKKLVWIATNVYVTGQNEIQV